METLNVKMDTLAKSFSIQAINDGIDPPSFGSLHGYYPIYCHGQLICSNLQKSLYNSITHHQFLNKLSVFLDIPVNVCESTIHWKSFSRARKEDTFSRRRFLTKLISNTHATGVNMVRRQQRIKSSCPFCNHPHEDIHHIFHCHHHSPSALRQRCPIQHVEHDPAFTCHLVSRYICYCRLPIGNRG